MTKKSDPGFIWNSRAIILLPILAVEGIHHRHQNCTHPYTKLPLPSWSTALIIIPGSIKLILALLTYRMAVFCPIQHILKAF